MNNYGCEDLIKFVRLPDLEVAVRNPALRYKAVRYRAIDAAVIDPRWDAKSDR